MKEISWEDFEKVDVRVGTIVDAQEFPQAKKPAFKLKIDFGPLGVKKSSAQITDLYTVDDLKDRQVIAVLNFAPKQIGPFISECLILGVVGSKEGVVLLQPTGIVPNGLKIG